MINVLFIKREENGKGKKEKGSEVLLVVCFSCVVGLVSPVLI